MHFNQLQETVEGAKTAVDAMLESVQATVNDTEGVQPTADLPDYVQQNSWLLMGSATLMGYTSAVPPVRTRLPASHQPCRSRLVPAETPSARVALLAPCAAKAVDDLTDRRTISNGLPLCHGTS